MTNTPRNLYSHNRFNLPYFPEIDIESKILDEGNNLIIKSVLRREKDGVWYEQLVTQNSVLFKEEPISNYAVRKFYKECYNVLKLGKVGDDRGLFPTSSLQITEEERLKKLRLN